MPGEKGEELLQKLKAQGLNREEIENRLNAILDAEYAQPEERRDRELIDACVALQWFLMTGEPYQSNKEAVKKRLDDRIRERETGRRKKQRWRPRAALTAAACAAVLILVIPIAAQTLLSRREITGETIAGGEVYRLNGVEVDAGTLQQAVAEDDLEDISIVTNDYAALSQIPAVRKLHPQYIPKGWKISEYQYKCTEEAVYYYEKYQKAGEEKELTYRCIVYPNALVVNDNIQQNGMGDEAIVGAHSVYFTENYDMLAAMWSDELASYSLFAPLEKEEILKIIDSIEGEERL